jgi:hypothetical protein
VWIEIFSASFMCYDYFSRRVSGVSAGFLAPRCEGTPHPAIQVGACARLIVHPLALIALLVRGREVPLFAHSSSCTRKKMVELDPVGSGERSAADVAVRALGEQPLAHRSVAAVPWHWRSRVQRAAWASAFDWSAAFDAGFRHSLLSTSSSSL